MESVDEARENLNRQLMFGGDAELNMAWVRVEAALERRAEQDKMEHGDLIDEILVRLKEPENGEV